MLTAVFLCVVLKQATLAEALDTYMSEEMRETYWFDSALVSGLLVAIIAGAALVAIGFAVQQFLAAARKPIIRLKSTGKAPVLSLGEGQKWHLFLSHIWSTGQDANATIKRQLCLLGCLDFPRRRRPEVLPPSSHLTRPPLTALRPSGHRVLEEYIAPPSWSNCSARGYFRSKNRLAKCALPGSAPVTLMADPERAARRSR